MKNKKKQQKAVVKPKVVFVNKTEAEIEAINKKTSNYINLIYALSMVQETLIIDVEQMQKSIDGYKYNIKNRIINIKDNAISLRAEVAKKTDAEFATTLGDESEKIWDMLVEMYSKQIEQQK